MLLEKLNNYYRMLEIILLLECKHSCHLEAAFKTKNAIWEKKKTTL